MHSSFEDESFRLHFHCSLGNYKDAGFCSYAGSSDLPELRDLGNQGIYALPGKSSTELEICETHTELRYCLLFVVFKHLLLLCVCMMYVYLYMMYICAYACGGQRTTLMSVLF